MSKWQGFRLACFWEGVEGKNALKMFGLKSVNDVPCCFFFGVVKEENKVPSGKLTWQ